MKRRAFIVALGSAAVWPVAACGPLATMGPSTYFADPGQYGCVLAERISLGQIANWN